MLTLIGYLVGRPGVTQLYIVPMDLVATYLEVAPIQTLWAMLKAPLQKSCSLYTYEIDDSRCPSPEGKSLSKKHKKFVKNGTIGTKTVVDYW